MTEAQHRHPTETEEWLDDRVATWVETYKKSMLAPVVLAVLQAHPASGVAEVATRVAGRTGWEVTERGLYRTVRRLQDAGLIDSVDADAPRTGAKRKVLTLSPTGAAFLTGVRSGLVPLDPDVPTLES